MGKGSSATARHREMKDKAKSRVDDLQGMLANLQSAREESRSIDVNVLEEQVHLMLKDWKSELDQPSPSSSLQAGSLGSFSSEINRLLRLGEEEDDATSPFLSSKLEPEFHKVTANDTCLFEGFNVNEAPSTQDFHVDADAFLYSSQSYDTTQELGPNYSDFVNPPLYVENSSDYVFSYFPTPPSAFLGPKCSRWDCIRPAQGLDHCSRHCADLALKEGPPGMTPVLRPCGIGLKECLLFAVLNAKAQNKDVGIPECEGGATAKCPWNAPELFDISVLEGETIREWLFFDKPRRAFENGNRKQRSLPDYIGRGWHESRKQVMNEFNGQKRSYYMDPQPRKDFEWHLYEYEIYNFDACALYRLEYKRVGEKKSPKGKSPTNDSVADLQKQMGRLTAEFPTGNKRSGKAKAKASLKDEVENTFSVPNQVGSVDEGFGAVSDYLVADLDGYYFDETEKGMPK